MCKEDIRIARKCSVGQVGSLTNATPSNTVILGANPNRHSIIWGAVTTDGSGTVPQGILSFRTSSGLVPFALLTANNWFGRLTLYDYGQLIFNPIVYTNLAGVNTFTVNVAETQFTEPLESV